MKPPVQVLEPRKRSGMASPRNRPNPASNSGRVVGVVAKVLVSCEIPPVAIRMEEGPCREGMSGHSGPGLGDDGNGFQLEEPGGTDESRDADEGAGRGVLGPDVL